jgi:hypothetical protein
MSGKTKTKSKKNKKSTDSYFDKKLVGVHKQNVGGRIRILEENVKELKKSFDFLNSSMGILHRVLNDALSGQTRVKTATRKVLEDDKLVEKTCDVLDVSWYRTQQQLGSAEDFTIGKEVFLAPVADVVSKQQYVHRVIDSLMNFVKLRQEDSPHVNAEMDDAVTRALEECEKFNDAVSNNNADETARSFDAIVKLVESCKDAIQPFLSDKVVVTKEPEFPEGAVIFGGEPEKKTPLVLKVATEVG